MTENQREEIINEMVSKVYEMSEVLIGLEETIALNSDDLTDETIDYMDNELYNAEEHINAVESALYEEE